MSDLVQNNRGDQNYKKIRLTVAQFVRHTDRRRFVQRKPVWTDIFFPVFSKEVGESYVNTSNLHKATFNCNRTRIYGEINEKKMLF